MALYGKLRVIVHLLHFFSPPYENCFEFTTYSLNVISILFELATYITEILLILIRTPSCCVHGSVLIQ